jgi:hypothetical protein
MRAKIIAFMATLLVASVASAGPWDDIIKFGYAVSGGPLTGAMGFAVCEQVDDDTTPSIGTPPASFPSGCNVLLTSTNHSGPISITRFDDAESGVEPVTSTLYEQVLWVVGRAATNQTTIADGANFRLKEIPWDSPATGDHSVIQFKATYLTAAVASVADGGGGTSLDVTSNAHGLVVGQTVTLSSMSVVAYDGTYVINSVAVNTFNVTAAYSATATGTWDAIRFDEMWRSGNVDDYFYQNMYVKEGNATDFANGQVVVGRDDTGITSITALAALVGEASADGSNPSAGILAYGETSSAQPGTGGWFYGIPNATGDTTVAYGVRGYSSTTHASGDNVAIYGYAANSSTKNYAYEMAAGDFATTLGTDMDMYTEGTSTAVATNPINFFTGAPTNAGDYNSGAIAIYTGATTTAGDSGNVSLYSGNGADSSGQVLVFSGISADAAEVSGNVAMYSGAQNSATGGSSGTAKLYTGTAAGTAATGAASLYSGNQTNTGDYTSGNVLVYSGSSTATLGDTGTMSIYTGNAADESGLIDIYTGTSTNAGESSGGIGIATGNQTGATGGSSGSVSVITGTAAGTSATGDLDFYTGNQINVGDYSSGSVDIRTGTSATLGNTGAVAIRSGDAADTSGAVSLYSGTSANTAEVTGNVGVYSGAQAHATGGSSGSASVYSGAAAGQATTGVLNLYTGDQTNVGDYNSGQVDIQSGSSATAGDTGPIAIRSGNAADTSGAVSLYSGTSAAAGEASGAASLYSGAQSSATGGASGTAKLYTGTAAGTSATGIASVYTGNQTNVGDYASGQLDVYTGTSATLGDTGAVAIRSGDAADTSGAISLYSGASANTGEVSGAVTIYSGAQGHATGGSSGDLTARTGTAAGQAATGAIAVYSGNQSNVGDYDSGAVDVYTGTSTTLGDTGAIGIHSGNAADTSGAIDVYTGTSANAGEASGAISRYTGNQAHASGGASGGITDYTGSAAGAAQSGSIISYTGAQTNTANVPSGAYTWTTGATTTDGNTGSFTFTTGVAGAGSGDAGSFIVQTHGANPRLTIDGAGVATFTGAIDAESYMALGNGSALASNKTLVIDRDFSDASDGEALSVTGSQIIVTAGVGDIHHTMMNPGSSTFNTAATVHNYATTLNILEPNIALADEATIANASTVRIVNAPSEGTTSNWALWVDSGDVKFDGALTVDGLLTAGGGMAMGADLDMQDWNIKNPSVTYQEAQTSDAAADELMINAGDAYEEATGGNQVGADLVQRGGIGTRQVTIDDFNNCALDTVTSTNDGVACVCTEADGGGANQWDAVTDNATSATNLATCLDACPGVGASATAAVVYMTIDVATEAVVLAEGDATCTSLTSGVDGNVVVHTAHDAFIFTEASSYPFMAFGGQTASELGFRAEGTWLYLRKGDNSGWADFAPGQIVANGAISAGTASAISWGSRSEMRADADGDVKITNAAETQGVYANTQTDGVLNLYDEAGGALVVGANTFQNTLEGATATFSSVNAAAAATGTVSSVSGNVTGVGDFASGAYTAGTGDSSNTAGDSSNVTLKSGDAADDSGDVDVKMGVATAGASGDFHVIGDGVNTYFTVTGETGATDVANAFTAGTIASDAQVTGTYGTFALGAAEKFYLNASTTEHTGTAGVLDLDLVPTTDATGVVAADIHITAPALGIEATTHVGLNIQYSGDAQDEGASIVQLIQVGFQPNTSGTTVYGMYSADNDLDYFLFNDGTAESRFDGEVHFANNAAAATFGLATTDADVVVAFDALTQQGSITYMEDEDRFDFDNDVDVLADLTAGTITSDAGITGTDLTTDGVRVKTSSADATYLAAEAVTVTDEVMKVAGNGGHVTLTSDPSIVDGTDDQVVVLRGTNDAATLEFEDEAQNPGSGLALSGNVDMTLGIGDVLILQYDAGDDKWYELGRSDN